MFWVFFFFQAEDGIRDLYVTGVQTCALPIWRGRGVAQRPATRDDRDLVDRVGVRQCVPDQRVPALVVGDDLALFLGQQDALALRAGHHPVDGLLQRPHGDQRAVVP